MLRSTRRDRRQRGVRRMGIGREMAGLAPGKAADGGTGA